MTILSTIVLLGVLIFVHELGHFWAAKAVGVGVERFSIGLGPRLWGFRRGETEYVIAAIPLGGYVKMQGMEDEVMERVEGGAAPDAPTGPRAGDFDGKPLWARAFVISAGVIMNMVFAFGIYSLTAAVWGVQEEATTRVMAVQDDLLPPGTEALGDMVSGATIVQVGDERPETWRQITNGLIDAEPGPLSVVTSSPSARFEILMPASEEERIAVARALDYWVDPVIGMVTPGSAAERGGIEIGDTLLSVAGTPVVNWNDVTRELRARPDQEVQLRLQRDGSEIVRIVTLGSELSAETGVQEGRLGVIPSGSFMTVSVGFGEALTIGWNQTAGWTLTIVDFVKDLFTFNVSPRSVGSIGTIAQASGQAAADGLATFLRFMAFFSINLAVLNLLPIPILDGGHLVFLAIELVRGQALSIEQRVRWSQVGLVIVVGIMVWALGNDILRALGL
ncbi:MAG: RIP metalloprotease RseP [Gemmatimonadetes bacterium]|nr:RIP metalloprotease RseP [Gemmatimonadota bacterium]